MTPLSSSPEARVGGARELIGTAPPVDRFRDLMAAWPTGVAVVTGTDGARPLGCTVTALTSVSVDPPLLLVSLATGSRTLAAVQRNGRFGVCVLSAAQHHLARAFAAGEPTARFDGVPFRWNLGVPLLQGTATGAVCVVGRTVTVADHVLVLGRPMWLAGDPGIDPVIWYRREAHALAGIRADAATPGGF
ncbi:flavin reductase family protein [Phytohabitans houttuyneae]|uniref:Oxidoreductase n=1 Tax=Phytohabitans houttuyneae TaxID=1076126 RepID=A0A6V8KFY4_9ACTN|nr:flavin reductase family protein [Phytohabitans houttuyneae]GFJ81288.1 oxidoreductase [Phytohabitans houttuyneae]